VGASDASRHIPEEVPSDVIAQARAVFGQRTPGEVAVLVRDSLVDEAAPASDHELRFEHPRMRIVLRVCSTSEWSSLQGEVEPPTARRAELVLEGTEVRIVTDVEDGAFNIERVPSGVARLCLEGPDGTPVYTDWFRA
jgi:hypothetical protein